MHGYMVLFYLAHAQSVYDYNTFFKRLLFSHGLIPIFCIPFNIWISHICKTYKRLKDNDCWKQCFMNTSIFERLLEEMQVFKSIWVGSRRMVWMWRMVLHGEHVRIIIHKHQLASFIFDIDITLWTLYKHIFNKIAKG